MSTDVQNMSPLEYIRYLRDQRHRKDRAWDSTDPFLAKPDFPRDFLTAHGIAARCWRCGKLIQAGEIIRWDTADTDDAKRLAHMTCIKEGVQPAPVASAPEPPVKTWIDQSLIRREPKEELAVKQELNAANLMAAIRAGNNLSKICEIFQIRISPLAAWAQGQKWPRDIVEALDRLFPSRMWRLDEDAEKLAEMLAERADNQDAGSGESGDLTGLGAIPADPTGPIDTAGITAEQPAPKPAPGTASEPAPGTTEARPELTRESLEAALKAGNTIEDLARMFGVGTTTISLKKKEWELTWLQQHGKATTPGSAAPPAITGVDMATGPDRIVMNARDANAGEVLDEADSLTDMITRAKALIANFKRTEDECNQDINYLIGVVVRCVRRREVLERMVADLEESGKPEAAS
jgi:hypothetical protein